MRADPRRALLRPAQLRTVQLKPEQPKVRPAPGKGGSEPTVSIVIPTLNEARNLPHVLTKIPASIHEVIICDGHSLDGTLAVACELRPDIRVVMQNRTGKGNALACGFAAATGDIIVMLDADGSADPDEIPRFVQALVRGADFAKGSRFCRGGGSVDLTRFRALGNRGLCRSFNIVYKTRYSDLCYGYNAFWRRIVPALGLDAVTPAPSDGSRLWGDGFEVETLLSIRATRAGLAVVEVASFEHSRIHGVSNLSAISDGLRVLRTILVERAVYRRHQAELARAGAPGVEALTDVDAMTSQSGLRPAGRAR